MANAVKMQEEFNKLMKKYESASAIREWNNVARNNMFDENERIRKHEIKKFKERFQAAVDANDAEKMEKEFNALFKKYDSASKIREWQNGASGNTYAESEKVRLKEIAGFRTRFDEAVAEVVA